MPVASKILLQLAVQDICQLTDIAPRLGATGDVDAGPAGLGPPAFMAFPVTAGLTGEAIRSRNTVVANDVSKDSRYLTSFASTRAEIIVPVLDATGSSVVGTIDVESDREIDATWIYRHDLVTGERVPLSCKPRALAMVGSTNVASRSGASETK